MPKPESANYWPRLFEPVSPIMLSPDLRTSIEAWIAGDISLADQDELRELLAAASAEALAAAEVPAAAPSAASTELQDRFAGDLSFGTAGLRGQLAAGPNRMNRAVVVRTTWALSQYLSVELISHDLSTPARVVIGFDHRRGSAQFAQDAAGVLQAAGHQVLLIAAQVPTPALAFAVRTLGAEAGIMITASHNPPQDNGYKLYLGGRLTDEPGRGVQIVSPVDERIAQLISQAPPAVQIPRAKAGWSEVSERLLESYSAQVLPLIPQDPIARARRHELRIVYTPMHGVGGPSAVKLLQDSGFSQVEKVTAQFAPDPAFLTAPFPNPEEEGALTLAFAQAVASNADVVLANDPDADRLAVGFRDVDGRWRALHGNELGALLALHLLRTGALRPEHTVASSLVSGSLLPKMAAAHGLKHETTLTGFKWLARVPGLGFGYEEAIGYCLAPGIVRDKDGLSTALVAAEMCSLFQQESAPGPAEVWRGRGGVVVPELVNLAKMYGLHVNTAFSLALRNPRQTLSVLSELLSAPPSGLGSISATADLGTGWRGLPPTPGVALQWADGTSLLVRPSGTEPKLKFYFEGVAELHSEATATDYAAARQELQRQHQQFAAALQAWSTGLLGEAG